MPRIGAGPEVFDVAAIIFDKDNTLLDGVAFLGRLFQAREKQVYRWAGPEVVSLWRKLSGVADEPPRPQDRWVPAPGKIWLDRRGSLFEAAGHEEVTLLAGALAAGGRPWADARAEAQALLKAADEDLSVPDITWPFPGVPELLKDLKKRGFKLAVATADGLRRSRQQLAYMGVLEDLVTVVTPERVKRPKPFPDMVELACEEMGLLAEQTLMVGDSPVDGEMGKAAGCRATIGIGSSTGDPSLWDVILPAVTELRPL
ncbi:MAG: HAD-IA family hydrolase [Bacillota bacterium]|nr:HAD-IA family hydrolase [Bacillota bacterium]